MNLYSTLARRTENESLFYCFIEFIVCSNLNELSSGADAIKKFTPTLGIPYLGV